MPVNEFEKKVQQKMDELQFRPSEEVWIGVEKQIRNEKRRRRIVLFWWLLPVFLIGGGSAYFIFNNQKPEIITQQLPSQQPREDNSTGIATEKNGGSLQQNRETINPAVKDDLLKNRPEADQTVASNNSFATNNDHVEINVVRAPLAKTKKAQKLLIQPGKASDNASDITPTIGAEILNRESVENKNVVTAEPPLVSKAENKEEHDLKVAETLTETKTDSVAENLAEKPISALSKEISPSAPAVTVKRNRSKWEFGIIPAVGLSNTRSGKLFEVVHAQNRYQYSGTPGAGSGISYGPLAPPVLIELPKQGLSVAIEIFAEKKLSKKITVRPGIKYSFLSTKVKVGDVVSGALQVSNDISSSVLINSFYRAGSGFGKEDYTNKYHLLGIAGTVSWKLIGHKKIGLSWDNGFSVSRLLSTNALLFDSGLRGYYNDFSAFRKTHLFVSTGPAVQLWQHKPFSLSLNPFASYGFTPVLKKSGDMNSHFINYGIGLKFLLH